MQSTIFIDAFHNLSAQQIAETPSTTANIMSQQQPSEDKGMMDKTKEFFQGAGDKMGDFAQGTKDKTSTFAGGVKDKTHESYEGIIGSSQQDIDQRGSGPIDAEYVQQMHESVKEGSVGGGIQQHASGGPHYSSSEQNSQSQRYFEGAGDKMGDLAQGTKDTTSDLGEGIKEAGQKFSGAVQDMAHRSMEGMKGATGSSQQDIDQRGSGPTDAEYVQQMHESVKEGSVGGGSQGNA